jgi:hypothetical protein
MSDERSEEGVESTDLFANSVQHLVVLHRVLCGTIDEQKALAYLHRHLREDADLADMGRQLKHQYQANMRLMNCDEHTFKKDNKGYLGL